MRGKGLPVPHGRADFQEDAVIVNDSNGPESIRVADKAAALPPLRTCR
jgi:hypothetical protein